MKKKYDSRPVALIKLLIIIGILGWLIHGCAGTQVNWNIDKQALAELAACEIGYQLAKQYPNEAAILLKFANNVLKQTEPNNFANEFAAWKMSLLEKIGADAHYKRQLARLLPEIEFPESETMLPEWVNKVKPYVQQFSYGIEDAQEEANPLEMSEFEYMTARNVTYPIRITDNGALITLGHCCR